MFDVASVGVVVFVNIVACWCSLRVVRHSALNTVLQCCIITHCMLDTATNIQTVVHDRYYKHCAALYKLHVCEASAL
jgi:hypothetical protein